MLSASSSTAISAAIDDAPSTFLSIGSAFLYGSVSVLIVLFNKAVLSSFDDRSSFPFALAMFQALAGMLVFALLSFLNVTSNIPYAPSMKLFTSMLGISFANVLSVATSFLCLSHTTVPTYGMLKRQAIPITLFLDLYVRKKGAAPSWQVVGSVLVMTVSGFAMGLSDVSFSVIGYALGLGSAFFQSLFLVLSNRYFVDRSMNALQSAQLHCWASFPHHLLLFILTDEPRQLLDFSGRFWHDPKFMLCFWASVLLGVLLILSTQLCSIMNSALTVMVTGQTKSVLQAFVGIAVFSTKHSRANIVAIILGFVGSGWYAWAKLQERKTLSGPKAGHGS
eukprot:ANDGO_05020.mRNA.1 Putative UDP-sugar transporter DDB_G0278631